MSIVLSITNKRCRCLSMQIPNKINFFPSSGSFKFLMLQWCRRGLLTSEETLIVSNLLPLHPVYFLSFLLSCIYLRPSTSKSDRIICQTKTDNGYHFIPTIITHKVSIIGISGDCIILKKNSCLTFSISYKPGPWFPASITAPIP